MRIYVAYSVFYTLGSLMAMLITFVNFAVIRSSEHLASHCVFFIMNAYVLIEYVKRNLKTEQFRALTRLAMTLSVSIFVFTFFFLTLSGATRFSGRSMTLLDPTYAKKYMPIVASVSEHQPTSWSSYFFDLGYLILFLPVGFYYCLVHKVTLGKLFLGMYGVLATYFSCVMIRLMLVLAPIACIIAAIAIAEILRKATKSVRVYLTEGFEESDATMGEVDESKKKVQPSDNQSGDKKKKTKKVADKKESTEPETEVKAPITKRKYRLPVDAAVVIIVFLLFTLQGYIYHSTMLASEAYSSPSIILSGRKNDGTRYIVDDYREAYYWIKQNTPKEAKIMSWWDYGYQITGMSNRTVLVDNNTWNNTHIATVGRAMASNEEEAYQIARSLDANYVLVIFGGMSHYSGDDISKFLWMVRIAAGVFPQIKEKNYYSRGHYRVDNQMSQTMRDSLMYRLAYYRFGEIRVRGDKPSGWDTVRDCEIGLKRYELNYFREAYTSDRWMVRIYEVLPLPNRVKKINPRAPDSSPPKMQGNSGQKVLASLPGI
jgi:dolichyl-diphosphooligosaccharide--protein glycosyltransferase